MSTISIITCYIEWHRTVHLAPATRGGRLLEDNQSPATLIPLTARLCWWHKALVTLPSRGQLMSPAPGAPWQWDIGDPTQCIISQWSSNRSYFDNEILRHIPSYCPPISPQTLLSPVSVPARQFMLHSILKCIMNLYKRESLLSWYVFFYSSIILPTSIKHWSYFHGRWIFNQSGEGICVRISRTSCA